MSKTESCAGTVNAAVNDPAPGFVRLPAQLAIDSVASLKRRLEPLLALPGAVVLDASEVERIHTAALQLFCLFCRDRRAAGREIEFARPSAALCSAAALLGATSLLRLAQGAA